MDSYHTDPCVHQCVDVSVDKGRGVPVLIVLDTQAGSHKLRFFVPPDKKEKRF
jgi:O-phosphoseryl-tRNA(Cys) synthetase